MLLLQHFTKQCTKCKEIKIFDMFNNSISTKDGLNPNCKICRKKYRQDNKEAIKHKDKTYYEQNKDYISLNKKKYNNFNKEKIAKKTREYYINNRESILNMMKKYNNTPMGLIARRNVNQRRRAKERKGDVSSIQLLELQQNANVCYWCNQPLKNKKVHIDHYIPLSKGGLHTISNLVVSCKDCNFSKHAKDPIAFANSIGKLL